VQSGRLLPRFGGIYCLLLHGSRLNMPEDSNVRSHQPDTLIALHKNPPLAPALSQINPTDLISCFFKILWRVSPMRELLKPGASKQARNRRRTSVYSSLLCNARNRRKSKHASPASLVSMQHRSCGSYSPRNNSSRVSFSVRSALTNSTTEISVLSAPRLYNATLGMFASQ
jgi:hypothetical protein